MTLLDEARVTQAANHRGPDCRVIAVRSTLAGGLVEDFDRLIAADDIHATTAASVLKAHQIILPSESIQRHRRGACKCSDVAA